MRVDTITFNKIKRPSDIIKKNIWSFVQILVSRSGLAKNFSAHIYSLDKVIRK